MGLEFAPSIDSSPVVVFANRLPVVRTPKGWRPASGGLVSALRPVLEASGGAWVGWSGSREEPPAHIGGLAPFVVTGFSDINGQTKASTLTGQNYCDTSTSCLYGYFTRDLRPTDTWSTAPTYGAMVIGTIG